VHARINISISCSAFFVPSPSRLVACFGPVGWRYVVSGLQHVTCHSTEFDVHFYRGAAWSRLSGEFYGAVAESNVDVRGIVC
jgi:hypothetical protein